MPTTVSDEKRQEIIDALLQGQKIQAIKAYREATGLGLKEAKDFIDTLIAQVQQDNPDAFKKTGSGCGSVVLLCVALVVGLIGLLGLQ